MSQPDTRWIAGSAARTGSEVAADELAIEQTKVGRFIHLTEFANRHALYEERRFRCVACHGGAHQDADEVKCAMCGRTLAWIGYRPMRQEDAHAELTDERSSEQHRKAAQARWSGRSGQCLKGHPVEGDNAMSSGDRKRCRQCYLAARWGCPRGHRYTDENTSLSRDGKRRCVTCADKVKAAKAKRHTVAGHDLRIGLDDIMGVKHA